MSRKYKFRNTSGIYFVSFATVRWVDVFTRQLYFDVLVDSMTFCRNHKSMQLYAYVIMPNHLHFIFRSSCADPSGLLRDFKKFTSRKMVQGIQNNRKESRKEWLLQMSEEAGKERSNVEKYQFWQQNNHPLEVRNEKSFKQIVNYIHQNPVKSGFVVNPIDWKYSSAKNFQDDHSVLEIDMEDNLF